MYERRAVPLISHSSKFVLDYFHCAESSDHNLAISNFRPDSLYNAECACVILKGGII